MSIFKRLPWMSLLLVLVSYSTLGWVLSEMYVPAFVWVVVVIAVLLLVGSLTTPLPIVANYSSILFRSTTRTFLAAVLGAFLFFLILAWFKVFLDTLLIVAAAILARIDFQTAGFKERLAFFVTSLCSLVGMAFGAAMQIVLSIYSPIRFS
jgi:hypothetical protein